MSNTCQLTRSLKLRKTRNDKDSILSHDYEAVDEMVPSVGRVVLNDYEEIPQVSSMVSKAE